MTLLNPAALALAVLSLPIILMYVLKLRRKDVTVSSTVLWRRALEEVQANTPWQRLRASTLLLLQLLALAAIVLALAGPAYGRSEVRTGDIVVIVDESFMMQAHDVVPSRFTVAQQRARRLAATLAPGSVMSVIGMSRLPRLKIAESSDREAIDSAIDSLRPDYSEPDFLAALSLSKSLARNGENTRLVILTSSDGGITGLPIRVSFPVQIVRLGRRLLDLGSVAFSASRSQSRTAAVLRLHNFGARRERSDLDLFVDGQLADVRPVSLASGQDQSLFWQDLPPAARELEAHLTVHDDVSADKSAWATASTSVARRILLVSAAGDLFLQSALGLDPSASIRTIVPGQYSTGLARKFDLVAFDGFLPVDLPPTSVLLVSPPAGSVHPSTLAASLPGAIHGSIRFGGEIGGGSIAPVAGRSGEIALLLRYVDLADVHLARLRQASLPGWLRPLAVSHRSTVIAAGQNNDQRVAVFAFDLQKSDWPLRISYPIAMQNVLHYLVPGLALGSSSIEAGQPLRLFPDPATVLVKVTKPDGTVDTVTPPITAFADTSQPGLYRVQAVGGSVRSSVVFAANLSHPSATPVSGPPTLSFGRSRRGLSRSLRVPASVAWVVGIIALGVLTIEWWYALRR